MSMKALGSRSGPLDWLIRLRRVSGCQERTMLTSRTAQRSARRTHPEFRTDLESLEPRVLLSSYVVTGLGDAAGVVSPTESGRYNATTLRAAIVSSNARAGADTITFA